VNGRRSTSRFTSRILIGAVTVLILMIAVFLAYTANSGLPFVPIYEVNADVPDAAGLIPSDQVLLGGSRVGYIGSIDATRLADGRNIAVLHLKLDKSIEPLPADSTILVRPVSPLGLKYLQLTRGHSAHTLAAGATLPLSQTHLPVEIDDFFGIFDARTRRDAQTQLDNFGDGFAGRGADLNQTLSKLKPLVDALLPVTTNLLDPRTRWAQLFPSLEQAAHEVVGVADQQAELFAGIDETFAPLASDTSGLRATIAGAPAALTTATRELPAQAQFIDDTAELFHRLRPAFVSLGNASAQLAPAEAAGIPALRRTPQLNDRLVATLQAIQRFAEDSRTVPGLEILTETAQILEPTVAFIEPAQTSCNYLALFFRNLENALSESDSVGTMLRTIAITPPQLPNSEAGPASAPADGPPASAVPGLTPVQQTLVQDSFLHTDPYPATAAPGQPQECEAGNERYVAGRTVIGTAPVTQTKTEKTTRVLP
jgi:virulence factor Mce-like protein